MRIAMLIVSVSLACGLLAALPAMAADAEDWPQLNHDAGRTGHSSVGVAPPYQARWIWCGPDKTLRNKFSDPAWSDDIGSRAKGGPDYPMPARVKFTFAGRAQPVVADGVVFIGDMEGDVYAISLDDGKTLWVGKNPGGTNGAAAIADGVVVVTSITGALTGLDVNTGRQKWRIELPKAVTGSVLAVGSKVFTGCHDGNVYAVEASSGKRVWTKDLGAPIVADLCGDAQSVYIGAEDMWFYKLDINSGDVLAKTRLNGQSFRMLHPVLQDGRLYVRTVLPVCVGSEYVMENVMRDSKDIAEEQKNILRWLSGDTNGGRWSDASPAWKHLYVLNTSDLSEPYTVPDGPSDGCGKPCPPVCIDDKGRAVTWFKTRYPTFTKVGSFGTKYSMDISAIDPETGLRIPIDNGRLSGQTGETDNLFALTCGGPYVYLRQGFRGTKMIDMRNSSAHLIQVAVGTRDGGSWAADVIYRNTGRPAGAAQRSLRGRHAPTIVSDGKTDLLLFAESYCVTAVEHRP